MPLFKYLDLIKARAQVLAKTTLRSSELRFVFSWSNEPHLIFQCAILT